MARLTIVFQRRPQGGQKVFRIDLQSDEDATPREHEQQHRRLVQAVLPGIDLDGENRQGVVVERDRPAREPMICPSCDDDGYEVIDLG
jgi:hypothetical protein